MYLLKLIWDFLITIYATLIPLKINDFSLYYYIQRVLGTGKKY